MPIPDHSTDCFTVDVDMLDTKLLMKNLIPIQTLIDQKSDAAGLKTALEILLLKNAICAESGLVLRIPFSVWDFLLIVHFCTFSDRNHSHLWPLRITCGFALPSFSLTEAGNEAKICDSQPSRFYMRRGRYGCHIMEQKAYHVTSTENSVESEDDPLLTVWHISAALSA